MSDTAEPMAPNTTERDSNASFRDWNFATGLPREDALQCMCRNAAALAVDELVKDIWLHISFSDGRNAPGPNRLEVGVHAWDGSVTLGRPFAEVMLELAQSHSYIGGEMDDDDASVLAILRELEAAVAMIRSRMRPRVKPE